MKILTASQAKDMDLQTIKKGISEDTLIEQAAYSVFEVVAELRPLKVLCVAEQEITVLTASAQHGSLQTTQYMQIFFHLHPEKTRAPDTLNRWK